MTHAMTRCLAARAAGALAIAINIAAHPTAQAPDRRQDAEAQRITAATAIVSEVTATDKGIPRAVLDKAEGIVVFPAMPRVTERRGVGPNTRRSARLLRVDGRGVLSVRGDGGTWSPPAFVNITSDSVPERTDLVLVIANRRTLENLMRADFPIDQNTAIAPGPTSGDAQAWTDAQRRAEIFSYSRAGGALQGLALTGGRVQGDTLAHQRFYGKSLTTAAAVAQTSGPPSIAPWRQMLQKQFSRR
jgi:lipid-binding SYLF domain-containing protein